MSDSIYSFETKNVVKSSEENDPKRNFVGVFPSNKINPFIHKVHKVMVV